MTRNIKQKAKKLVAHTLKLEGKGEFVRKKRCKKDRYELMPLLLIDSVLQAGMRYETVRDRVLRFECEYASTETVRQFKSLIDRKRLEKILDWEGRKVATLTELIDLLVGEGVDDVKQFRKWVKGGKSRLKLLGVYGIGDKTADYIKLLAGYQTTAVDRHITGFLCDAKVKACGYDEIWAVVKCAAEQLEMKLSDYDSSIWHYMRNK